MGSVLIGVKSVRSEGCGCRWMEYESHTDYEPCLPHALRYAGDMLRHAANAIEHERRLTQEESGAKR